MTYQLVEEKLYDYTAGVHCGVLVSEHVMKKLAKLQAKHLEDVKRVLTEHKEEIYPSHWTLYYPNQKQTVVRFVNKGDAYSDIDTRIKNAIYSQTPTYCKTVYLADSMEDAKKQANKRFEVTGEAE